MSAGGSLVVMDRGGRDVKVYPLSEGHATLGSDLACDIRFMASNVSPHHATVAVHYNQAVVRSESERDTLLNGVAVSVAALQHGDEIALGGRRLRWEYDAAPRAPPARQRAAPQPALQRRTQRTRAPRRRSEPPPRGALVPEQRASMPAATSGKQVAVVQPQRRHVPLPTNAEINAMAMAAGRRAAGAGAGAGVVAGIVASTVAAAVRAVSAAAAATSAASTATTTAGRARPSRAPDATTKATLWIESRKTSPRIAARTSSAPRPASCKKATPLRMAVLRRVQSAHKPRVTKIQAPLKMDSTKQAAIMLMTRHTPKSKPPSSQRGRSGPSFVVKKPSPVKSPANTSTGRKLTPPATRRATADRSLTNGHASVIELNDSESQSSFSGSIQRRSANSSMHTPLLSSTMKSALRGSSGRRTARKMDSIKFDLSNLTVVSGNHPSDLMVTIPKNVLDSVDDGSETDMTLRYSDSPSPRNAIHSQNNSAVEDYSSTFVYIDGRQEPYAEPKRKTLRSRNTKQKVSRNSEIVVDASTNSRSSTKSLTDQSWSTITASAHRSIILSPRARRSNLESYSIVDLVSDSNASISSRSGSLYDSANSTNSAVFNTPGRQSKRKLSSKTVPGFGTPIGLPSETSELNVLRTSAASSKSSKQSGAAINVNTSLTTPENTEDATRNITLNSTRISRASKKSLRTTVQGDIFDVEAADDSSPKSSRRISRRGNASSLNPNNIFVNEIPDNTPSTSPGHHTPDNQHSPVEASTPVLNLQSLLNASQSSNASPRYDTNRLSSRKSLGALRSASNRGRTGLKSKSLNLRGSVQARNISGNFDVSNDNLLDNEDGVVTPKSAAKPSPEGVKHKHSTAKKPLSKRSLIDNLNESDIVKQLFNSPVKRKLSRSMTEFSIKHLLDDSEDRLQRSTRATMAANRSTDTTLLNQSEPYTPDVFVSPLNTPTNSPNMTGVKRLFRKNSPENDLRNVRGVKNLLKTPSKRKSVKNDLSNVSGIKTLFARSPQNRLSDVRVKELFAASPKNDLRRVTGVKGLFKSKRKTGRLPRNELEDLRGVKSLFKEHSPKNDLRNVSGVRRTLRNNSPRNDLTDVRGVKRLFRDENKRKDISDVSGVERLFQEVSNYDSTFDQLLGRPPIRAVYTKSKSFTATSKVQKGRRNRKSTRQSLHDISLITDNVEEWLQKKIMEQVHKKDPAEPSPARGKKLLNNSKNSSKTNLMRELEKLNTDTIEGSAPVIVNRTRNSSILTNHRYDTSSRKKSASELYSAHTLPIKKRSLIRGSSNNSSIDKLPIKKRLVVHSTPVKGRVNITMNASEIGRMSPISSKDKSTDIETLTRPQSQLSPKVKSPAVVSAKDKSVEIARLSPKNTRSARTVQISPAVPKTRSWKKSNKENQGVVNVKKRRSSLVIKKKAPVLSPQQPRAMVSRRGKNVLQEQQESPKISPKKTRSTKRQKSQVTAEVKVASPKVNTRAKVIRTSLIVSKSSPKLKIRTTRNTKEKEFKSATEVQTQTKRKRKVTITEPEVTDKNKKKTTAPEPTQAEVRSKRRAGKLVVAYEPTVDRTAVEKSSIIQTRRARKTIVEIAQTELSSVKAKAQNKRTRNITQSISVEEKKSVPNKSIEAQVSVETVTRSGRRNKVNDTRSELNEGKRRKTTEQPAPKSLVKGKRANATVIKEQPMKGERTVQDIQTKENPVALEQPTGRGRKRKNRELEELAVNDYVEKKQTRGPKAPAKDDNLKSIGKIMNTRRRAGDAAGDEELSKTAAAQSAPQTRGGRAAAAARPARGKKNAVGVEGAAQARPQAGGRNKRNLEISDAKENKKEPAKKPRQAAGTPPRAGRAAVGASARRGRSRRS